MRPSRLNLSSFLPLLLFSPTWAFWRLTCQNGGALTYMRADPIVNPGGISGHVHTISGGSNFNLDMDFATAREAKCSSCICKQDMSNYWTPALYFAWANGSFTLVEQVGLTVYYLQRHNDADRGEITAFPPDFRMLAGNPYLRSYNESNQMATQIGANCLGGTAPTRRPYLPTENCPNGLRLEVMFPSCWDGVNVDSTDHQSHVAYPKDNESGPCPDTHPERLLRLSVLISILCTSVDPLKDEWENALNTSQPFVLAMGDPTGYGLHGDFLNGWDVDVLQEAIETCTDDSGVIEKCAVFDLYDYSQPETECHQSSAINEVVTGTLDALPGCNKIDYGPDDVTLCSEDNPPAINQQMVISGGLSGGNFSIDVFSSASGKSSSGTSSGSSIAEDDNDDDGASSTGSGSTSTSKASSPSAASSSGFSSSPSSAGSSALELSSTAWIGIGIAGVVLPAAAVALALHCRAQGRRQAQANALAAQSEEEEKAGLRASSSSDGGSDSSSDDDSGDDGRRR
ncbi:hypothetical protein JCM10207_003459 [Rhodosporidiobolus poonsookiae]